MKILLLDDDGQITRLMSSFLTRLGYEVEAFTDAAEARRLFDDAPNEFALAIIDFVLPGASGSEIAREFLAANPSLRVLLSSGLPVDLGILGDDRARAAFLLKPFRIGELAEAVSRLTPPQEAQAAASA